MDKKIYSFKATGGGNRINGRVKAKNMWDATEQAMDAIKGYGQMNVNVSMFANQERAMREWEAQHEGTQ